MRRNALAFVFAAVLGLLVTGGFAFAGRPSSNYSLQLLTTAGEPQALGLLTSGTGASVTNATTAVPFAISSATVPLGVVVVQCDAVAYVGFSATCGTTLATSKGCQHLGTGSTKLESTFVLDSSTTSINAAGPAAFNCTVNPVR